MSAEPLEAVRFDESGLVPCVMQDWATGEVLTLAYMNDEALRRTLETGEMHFYSRSRDELWHKGETSGNVQRVRQIRYDCDGDALVALVEPAGPACHTGQRSCFYRDLSGTADPGVDAPPADGEPVPAAHEAAGALERTLVDRRDRRPEGSYTVELLEDPQRIGEKVREEADEVARAAAAESDERVAEEAADVLYHLQVLLLSRGVPIGDGAGDAQWPSPLSARPRCARAWPTPGSSPRSGNAIPIRMTFVDDCETPVSAFLKLRDGRPLLPARVGRAGTAGALLVPRLQAAGDAAVFRW